MLGEAVSDSIDDDDTEDDDLDEERGVVEVVDRAGDEEDHQRRWKR